LNITWVLEEKVFSDCHDRLYQAAISAGHHVISWHDDWLENGKWPVLEKEFVVFHGSLNVASIIAEKLPWRPGSFCNTAAFLCSSWYEQARRWLVHDKWVFCSAIQFVNDPDPYLAEIGAEGSFFIRPDSSLKPFSGRVLQRDNLSLDALDYGFYYDDEDLPVVVTPVVCIGDEWRLIIARRKPIAASFYDARKRIEGKRDCPEEVWGFAKEIAREMPSPDPVYALDICRRGDELKLLEINPFSGADLYACDREAIVTAVEIVCKCL
jgi:hypothetical protein